MEVYPRSSWFLVLLGFALFAVTLQETTDCPTPDQVSCTSGTKCNSDEDCQSKEKCCANPCYTKRCILVTKDLRGDVETDGPSETDCRPYIEKALKELEIGEAVQAIKEPLEKDESSEDVPTIEITDDSSHQEEEIGGASDEIEEHTNPEEYTQQKAVPESIQNDESKEESAEKSGEKNIEKSDERSESEEETKTSKEESVEKIEQEDQASVDNYSEEKKNIQQTTNTESVESQEGPEILGIVKREAPEIPIESLLIQSALADSREDEQSTKTAIEKSGEEEQEDSLEQKEVNEFDNENDAEAQESKSKEESLEEPKQSKEESVEEIANDEKAADGIEEDEIKEVVDEEPSKEHEVPESKEVPAASIQSAEGIGCPPPNEVSCTEGELCTKHMHCGENEICCPNKCYRRRCTPGSVPQEELDAESASEESVEAKTEEKIVSTIPETGCPQPSEVSCTEGDLCSKHKHCGDEQICCPNKCYRRRCTPGTATSAELAAESDEDSQEEVKEERAQKLSAQRPETGCPQPSEVSCTEGDLCSKHKHCGHEQICCPNKCYRRRCTPGTATSAELAAESEEDSQEEIKEESVQKHSAKLPDTGCPAPNEISCVEGDLCSKHKHCGPKEICCPNKCYRRRCTPGTPTETDLADESDEESKEEELKGALPAPVSRKDTGCPERVEVPCDGTKCNKNKECDTGEICCANKCYRKVCVIGKLGSGEEEEESEEDTKENTSAEAVFPSAESQEKGGCPLPDKVSCKEGDRCGEDNDCASEEICCPNKCYNKRCITGVRKVGEESIKEISAEEPQPHPPKPRMKIPEPEIVFEVKKEYKPKVPPPPPPPEPKKEVKKPEIFKLKVEVEPVVEDDESLEKSGEAPVEELSLDTDVPTDLRPRDHVEHLLKIDQNATKLEKVQNKVYEETLKELKRLYENAIKPLEVLYKYRDLSNRHFGDAEIFSKPLILFMGPWSGGKSSIINYLLNNEYNETSLRTGAEPSPAYFNILMHGDEPEIIDGTELAADFTFSGLQKFGQGLEERLRGVKLPVRLLEKVNIVEIPGILEVRKQVSRVFPFNDACQWFIDRADIIFLVYDPSKLDVGPETEAILDQLKGREHQTRIILNKADQVKPEELMRVQGALIWNISPLMSSPQPPVMYTTSLWSRSYEPWAPIRLLQAQERAFLRDLRTAIDRRVENKIASARRFAVRVRNHAKMVDCYLTTYYNHKSVFGNRKQVANEIIERPQDYHIYEGLSTLTNISRYDLPDPDVYRDFFKLNPLYEFQQLSATCTYFRGCPINRLDIAIAYDLPELIGKYKRNLEEAVTAANNPPKESTPPAKKTKKSAPGS